MHRPALRTGAADPWLADLARAPTLAKCVLKRPQLVVCLSGGVDLLAHEVRALLVEALELDHEATDVTQLQFAQAAQVASTAAHLGGSGARAGATVSGKRVHGAHRRVPRV